MKLPRATRKRVWIAAGLVVVVIGVLGVATAVLFVWPASGYPRHADAIVLLNGDGDRFSLAITLADQGVAPNLVVSTGTGLERPFANGSCAPTIDGVQITCFAPHPADTRGEARFIAQLARQRQWHSIVLVTTRPQTTRARWRLAQCWRGHVGVAEAGLHRRRWPHDLLYEWAATIKAELLERGC